MPPNKLRAEFSYVFMLSFLPRDAMLTRNMCCLSFSSSVSLFICQKLVLYRNDWTAWRLPSTYATLSCNEIRVLQKIRVISRELCHKLWTRQFCHGKSIVIETRRRVMVVYHTSVDRNALTPLRRFAVDLLYDLFLQLCSS